MKDIIYRERDYDWGCWCWKFWWSRLVLTKKYLQFEQTWVFIVLFQVKPKISRDSCRSSFDLREAAGAKKGEERKDIINGLPPFQGSALPASWNTFTDTGKVDISRCFFSWVSRPPPWWPSDRSRLRSIGGERRRASVGWCGAAAAGVDQSEIEGRGGRQRDTERQITTQRRSLAYYWPANAQMALCRSPPHTIRDY